jgi:alkane 1-monooxygenase
VSTFKIQLEGAFFILVRWTGSLLPLIEFYGSQRGNRWAWIGVEMIFVFTFCMEAVLILTGIRTGTEKGDELPIQAKPAGLPFVRDLPVLLFLIQEIILIPLALLRLYQSPMSIAEWFGTFISYGVIVGVIGTLAAHEMIHRQSRWERWLGVFAFGLVNYSHFIVSHVRGHHRYVGTIQDWSTARKGESIYSFYFRAVTTGWLGAWRLDTKFMIRSTVIQALLWSTLAVLLGIQFLGLFISFSLFCCFFTELINYLGHYGLVRKELSKGRWEAVQNRHSWETNNKITNWLLYGAGKHCDHHSHPRRHHDELELQYTRKFLPYGLPTLTLMALFPPLLFRTLDPLIELSNTPTEAEVFGSCRNP